MGRNVSKELVESPEVGDTEEDEAPRRACERLSVDHDELDLRMIQHTRVSQRQQRRRVPCAICEERCTNLQLTSHRLVAAGNGFRERVVQARERPPPVRQRRAVERDFGCAQAEEAQSGAVCGRLANGGSATLRFCLSGAHPSHYRSNRDCRR